jgi:hypothetical protein
MEMECPFDVAVPLTREADENAKFAMSQATMKKQFDQRVQALEQHTATRLSAIEDQMRRQMAAVELQMNGRVFFGSNHSVHRNCTALVMADPDSPEGPILKALDTALAAQAAGQAPIKTVDKTNGGMIGQVKAYGGAQSKSGLLVKTCGCGGQHQNNCGCGTQSIQPQSLVIGLKDVASAADVAKHVQETHKTFRDTCAQTLRTIFSSETDYLMPLPSSELGPLQLCARLKTLTLNVGKTVDDPDFDLRFLIGLNELEELTIDDAQVRKLDAIAQLPRLKKLSLTNVSAAICPACTCFTLSVTCECLCPSDTSFRRSSVRRQPTRTRCDAGGDLIRGIQGTWLNPAVGGATQPQKDRCHRMWRSGGTHGVWPKRHHSSRATLM